MLCPIRVEWSGYGDSSTRPNWLVLARPGNPRLWSTQIACITFSSLLLKYISSSFLKSLSVYLTNRFEEAAEKPVLLREVLSGSCVLSVSSGKFGKGKLDSYIRSRRELACVVQSCHSKKTTHALDKCGSSV